MSTTEEQRCWYSPLCCYRKRTLKGWMLFKWKSWQHVSGKVIAFCLRIALSGSTTSEYQYVGFWAVWEMPQFQSAVSLSDWEVAAVREITAQLLPDCAEQIKTAGSKAVPWPENCILVRFHPSYLRDKSTLISHLIQLLLSHVCVSRWSPKEFRAKHWMCHSKQKYFSHPPLDS